MAGLLWALHYYGARARHDSFRNFCSDIISYYTEATATITRTMFERYNVVASAVLTFALLVSQGIPECAGQELDIYEQIRTMPELSTFLSLLERAPTMLNVSKNWESAVTAFAPNNEVRLHLVPLI